MIKYHISDSGLVVQCKAQLGRCPKENFDSIEAAEKFKEEKFSKTIPALSKNHDTVLKSAENYYGGEFLTLHNIRLSEGVESVLSILDKIGNPLIVGGAVRDSLIGAENKDIDIEVHKTDVDKLANHLKNKGFTVDEVGKQFGVLKVSKKGVVSDLDISVPRKENRLGAGHRSFEISMDENMTVSEAAERRDFAFNAIMYDHKRQLLVDPANGKKDFENKVMRHVSEKFAEDPLRVLRGFQFAGRFDMTMAPETVELSKKLRPEYEHLSVERVQEEWGKFFTKSTNPNKGLQVLQQTGWDDTTPGLKEALKKSFDEKDLDSLPEQDKDKRTIYGSAAIARHMSQKDKKEFLKTSIIGAKEQKQAEILSSFDKSQAASSYSRKAKAKELQKYGFTFNDYGKFSKMVNDREGIKIAELAQKDGIAYKPEADLIMGKDILEKSNKKPGPWMGELLNEIRDKQYKNEFNNKQEALDYALKRIEN